MADFGGDTDLEAFRQEARAWLEANFPASLKGKGSLATSEVRSDEPDLVANLANVAAALKEQFGWFWVGFYLVKGEELVLGPFQGRKQPGVNASQMPHADYAHTHLAHAALRRSRAVDQRFRR